MTGPLGPYPPSIPPLPAPSDPVLDVALRISDTVGDGPEEIRTTIRASGSKSAPPLDLRSRSRSLSTPTTATGLSASTGSLPLRDDFPDFDDDDDDDKDRPTFVGAPFVAGAFTSKHLRSSLAATTRFADTTPRSSLPPRITTSIRPALTPRTTAASFAAAGRRTRPQPSVTINERALPTKAGSLVRRKPTIPQRFAENMGVLGKLDVGAKAWHAPGGSPPRVDVDASPRSLHSDSNVSATSPSTSTTKLIAEDPDTARAQAEHQAALERLRQAEAKAQQAQLETSAAETQPGRPFQISPPTMVVPRKSEGMNDDELAKQMAKVDQLRHKVAVLRATEGVVPEPTDLPRPPPIRNNTPSSRRSVSPSMTQSQPLPGTAFQMRTATTAAQPRDFSEAVRFLHAVRQAKSATEMRAKELERRVLVLEGKLSESEAENRGLKMRAETLEDDLQSLNGRLFSGRTRLSGNVDTPRSENWEDQIQRQMQQDTIAVEAARKAGLISELTARRNAASGVPSVRPRATSLIGRPPVGLGTNRPDQDAFLRRPLRPHHTQPSGPRRTPGLIGRAARGAYGYASDENRPHANAGRTF